MENIQSYEDLKNNETIQSDNNLKILIKEIDEIKDSTTKDDDKIEWVFNENNENIKKTLNQWLIDSLNKQDKKIVEILINEINKIQNNNSLQLDNEVKDSLKALWNLLSWILKNSNDTNTGKTKEITITNIDEIKDMNLTKKQKESIKKIQDIWIEVNSDNIKLIVNNLDILGIDNKNFYEWYNYSQNEIESHSYYKKWRIIENIQQYVQNTINENRDIKENEIISQIRSDLITIPVTERIYILQWIQKVTEKFNTVRKYIDFENWPYKSPKELLFAMFWVNDVENTEIIKNITVKQHWCWLIFFVWDKTSYYYIVGNDSEWWSSEYSEIPLSVVNGLDSEKSDTILHEWQHNWNKIFMQDKENLEITKAKGEIIAYLKDWTWDMAIETRNNWFLEETDYTAGIDKIKDILTNEKWIYTYGLKWDARERYKEKVKELLSYVKELKNFICTNKGTWLTRDNIISMLSYTHADKRKDLCNSIKWTAKDNNKEFWRTWTKKKKAEVKEIWKANSIEDIKHILNDPKYSHIPRWLDNKWWIEISTMIDEVIAWKTDIKNIPSEIRQQVQKFIKI